ncbi:MAG: acyltransferase [Clostridia bacterium]|nr:acyltransferase [Clostridia bacterium]
MQKMRSRVPQMDLLRIAACLMVIGIHVIAEAMPQTQPGTFQWYVLTGYGNILRAAVPVFFMLSGMFSRSTDWRRSVKRALRFLLLYLLATLLYQGVYVAESYAAGLETRPLAKALLESAYQGLLLPRYHLWFMPEYIALVLAGPVIHAAIERVPALLNYAAAVFLLGTVGIDTVKVLFGGNALVWSIVSFLPDIRLEYLGYYLLGRLMFEHRQRITPKLRAALAALGVAGLVWVFVLTQNISMRHGGMDETYYQHFFAGICMQAIGWVALFDGLRLPERWHGLISRMASMTMSVYLTHIFVIEMMSYAGLRAQRITTVIGVPLKTAAVFAICCGMCMAWRAMVRAARRIAGGSVGE